MKGQFGKKLPHCQQIGVLEMDLNGVNSYCKNPTVFDTAIEPTVKEYLPAKDSIKGAVLEHTTGLTSLFSNISEDLCDDQRLGKLGQDSILRTIARGTASAAVASGALAAGIFGAPLAGVALAAVAGFTVAPPLVEKAVFGLKNFATSLLDRTRGYIQQNR